VAVAARRNPRRRGPTCRCGGRVSARRLPRRQPPSVLLALARAYRDAGDHRRAVFFAEQAVWRAGTKGTLRLQAERELERMIFPVVAESGFGDGPRGASRAHSARPRRRPSCTRATAPCMWARVSPHHLPWGGYITVRWIDPSGGVAREKKPRHFQRVYIADKYDFEDARAVTGSWKSCSPTTSCTPRRSASRTRGRTQDSREPMRGARGVTFVQNVLGGRRRSFAPNADDRLRIVLAERPPPLLAIASFRNICCEDGKPSAGGGLGRNNPQAVCQLSPRSVGIRPPRTFRTSPPPARLAATIQSRSDERTPPRQARSRIVDQAPGL